MNRHRLLLLIIPGILLLMPSLLEWWLFNGCHWLMPFLIWILLITMIALAEWRQRHHDF